MASKRKTMDVSNQDPMPEHPVEDESVSPGRAQRPTRKVRIRKNELFEDLYLDRNGQWTDWQHAAKFSSPDAAERFAAKCGIEVFGIF